MHLDLNIFQFFILLSAVNGFVWSLRIWFTRKNRKINRLLAGFIFLFALAGVKIVLQEHIAYFNHHLPVPLLYQFLFGPLLYLYVKMSLQPAFELSGQTRWHFLPSLLFDVLPALLIFLFYRETDSPALQKLSFLTDICACCSFAVYWRLTYRLLRPYKNETNSRDHKTVHWLRKILAFSLVILFTWLIYLVWVLAFHSRSLFGVQPYYPVYLMLSACVFAIGLAGYSRLEIGLLKMPETEKKVLIGSDALQKKMRQVLESIRQHHYYRDENLTLSTLAKQLGMPAKELSYLLNTGFRKNFSDFVNDLRVEDVKERLNDPANDIYSLLGLAYEYDNPQGYVPKKKTGIYRPAIHIVPTGERGHD